MNKLMMTAVVLTWILTACTPPLAEPGAQDVTITAPPPLPEEIILPAATAVQHTGTAAPPTLPTYQPVFTPIPATEEAALAWASDFGLAEPTIADGSKYMIRVMSRDAAAGTFEELTFLHAQMDQVIIYSNGVDWQSPGTVTPTPPNGLALPPLSPDEIERIAVEFLNQRQLLPPNYVVHEYPGAADWHLVHVAPSLSGYRLASVLQDVGVRLRVGRDGRVLEARIAPAQFRPIRDLDIQPFEQVYVAWQNGQLPQTIFYEWVQLDGLDGLDFARWLTHSQPTGSGNDRAELVYAVQPIAGILAPMWLVSQPEGDWYHILENYLPATGEPVLAPRPTPTPLGQTGIVPSSLEVLPPVLVDGAHGRLYTNAVVDGITHTVSLDAATGSLETVYGLSGDLALDAERNLLFVDKRAFGMTVIDTETGEVPNVISLPSGEWSRAQPQVDLASGNVLLFRDDQMLVADPLAETWQQTIPFTVVGTVCDEPMTNPPTIQQTWFDTDARLLYLSFMDYVCTPWISYTVVVYDFSTMTEVARYPGIDYMNGVAVDGRFYAKSWFRLGKTFQWAWQAGQPWLEQVDRGNDYVGGFSGFQVDEARGWLYEMTVDGLQVLDMETMAVLQTVPAPVAGELVGFDPVTDTLYFVGQVDGRLLPMSVTNLLGE